MRKNSQRGSIIPIVLLVGFVGACAYFLFGTDFFNVKHVKVVGNQRVSTAAIERLANIRLGESIFAINSKQVVQLVQTQPMVKTAEVNRRFPDTIEIEVIERQPWAVVPVNRYAVIIDDEGVYIDRLNYPTESRLPLVTLEDLEEPLTLGQFINKPAIEMIKVCWDKMSPEVRSQISEFHFVNADSEIIVYTLKGTEVRFGNLENVDEKVEFLAHILQMEKEFSLQGNSDLLYVDMRFQGAPVLKNR